MSEEEKKTSIQKYDFGTPEKAAIAARTLSVSDDFKPEESTSTFTSDGQFLVFSVKGKSEKHVNKAVSTTIPSIELVQQIIKEFALD